MDNTEYKILLKENSEHKNGYLWSLIEEGNDNVGKELTPWKGFISFSLEDDLWLTHSIKVGTSFDDETGKYKEENEANEAILAALLIDKCWNTETHNEHDQKPSMFGTNNEINGALLTIRKSKIPNNLPTCFVKGSAYFDEYSSGSISIQITLMPTEFNFIAELIKINRLKGLEILLRDPPGFYSAPDEDYIKVLTDSKMHKVETHDNCKITPPRLGTAHFSISAYRRDIVKLDCEESDSLDDTNKDENIQEYKQMHEKLLNRLERLEVRVGLPIWMIVGGLFGVYILGPALLEIGPIIKNIFLHFFPNASSFFN